MGRTLSYQVKQLYLKNSTAIAHQIPSRYSQYLDVYHWPCRRVQRNAFKSIPSYRH